MARSRKNAADRRALAHELRQHLARMRRMMDELTEALNELEPADREPPRFVRADFTAAQLRVMDAVVNLDDKYTALWDQLHMSKRTFDDHLASLYGKLGTRKRHGLARIAVRYRLV